MAIDRTADGPRLVRYRRNAAWFYIVAAYAIAWTGVWLIVSPYGFPGSPEALNRVYGVAFVAMAAGPPIASLLATAVFDGWTGVKDLFSRIVRWRVAAGYYAVALLLVPATIAMVLLIGSGVSPDFVPGVLAGGDPLGLLAMGIVFGFAAGWFEEIGWTGFATHRLLPQMGVLRTGLVLGVVHGFWHLLIGYWGEGASYGPLYVPYFLLLWVAGLVALRLLIVWLYERTGSVLIAQLAHASYSGGLMILWPVTSSPEQVIAWTGAFAFVLLAVAAAICRFVPRRV